MNTKSSLVFQLTIEYGKSRLTPLMNAVRSQNNEGLKILCNAKGIAVNKQHPQSGQTALHFAAQEGNFYMISSLISAGALPGTKCRNGKDALHYVRFFFLFSFVVCTCTSLHAERRGDPWVGTFCLVSERAVLLYFL